MATAAERLANNMNFGALGRASELRNRLLFTLAALIVFRLGTFLPIPGINPVALQQFFEQQSSGILGIFDTFSGGALGRMGIFALGVFIPALAVTWRRLHDINKSGMYFFLPVPFTIIEVILNSLSSSRGTNESISILFILVDLGVMLYLLILYCTDGDKKNNRFGKNIYLKKKKKRKIKATR